MRALTVLLPMAAFLLAGCGGLLGGLGASGPPPELYTLEPLERDKRDSVVASRLLVEEPVLSGALSSQRIAVRPGDRRYAYLGGARWEASAARLIQRYLAHSLDNITAFEAIGDVNSNLAVAFRLRLDVRAFNAVAGPDGGAPRVEIAWVATLVRGSKPEVIARRYFEVGERAGSDRPGDLVAAFNTAGDALVTDMADWIRESVDGSQATADAP